MQQLMHHLLKHKIKTREPPSGSAAQASISPAVSSSSSRNKMKKPTRRCQTVTCRMIMMQRKQRNLVLSMQWLGELEQQVLVSAQARAENPQHSGSSTQPVQRAQACRSGAGLTLTGRQRRVMHTIHMTLHHTAQEKRGAEMQKKMEMKMSLMLRCWSASCRSKPMRW
jgi:hypothetical protein